MNLLSEWQTYVAAAGALIAIITGVWYVHSIVAGPTRPLRVTWGGWSLVGILGLLSSVEGGAGIGLVATAPFVVLVMVIFVLSLSPKYGKPGGSRLDYIAGFIAAAVLLTQPVIKYSPAVGASVSVVADLIFFWPTVRETWRHPKLEAPGPWFLGAVAESLSIIALKNYSYASAAYPVYILVGNLTLLSVLSIKNPKKRTKKLKTWLSF